MEILGATFSTREHGMMKTVKRSDVTNFAMAAGKEKKITHIILDGILKEWVGIGWIDKREATPQDIKKYPTVKD